MLNFIFFLEAQTEILPRLQNFVKKFEVKKKKVQGGAIAILYKGKVIYKSAFGKQKGIHGCITEHTLFPLASTSKSISALVIAKLVEEGKLDFDEKFKIPCLKYKVSLEHLLSHTTGVGCRYWGNLGIENGMSRKKLMELLKKEAPEYKVCLPGTRYAYTNFIFSLIEDVLEMKKVSFGFALQQFRETLGTNEIQILPIDSSMGVAFPHVREGAVVKSLSFPPHYPKTAMTAAGIFSSLDGMVKILQLICGYRSDVISQKMLDRLYTPVSSNRDIAKWNIKWPCDENKIKSYYGLGWRILKAKEYPKKDLIFHSGYIGGIASFMGFIPSEDVAIVILLNEESKVACESGMEFWGEFLNEEASL